MKIAFSRTTEPNSIRFCTKNPCLKGIQNWRARSFCNGTYYQNDTNTWIEVNHVCFENCNFRQNVINSRKFLHECCSSKCLNTFVSNDLSLTLRGGQCGRQNQHQRWKYHYVPLQYIWSRHDKYVLRFYNAEIHVSIRTGNIRFMWKKFWMGWTNWPIILYYFENKLSTVILFWISHILECKYDCLSLCVAYFKQRFSSFEVKHRVLFTNNVDYSYCYTHIVSYTQTKVYIWKSLIALSLHEVKWIKWTF